MLHSWQRNVEMGSFSCIIWVHPRSSQESLRERSRRVRDVMRATDSRVIQLQAKEFGQLLALKRQENGFYPMAPRSTALPEP
jgi:hypothetical protein